MLEARTASRNFSGRFAVMWTMRELRANPRARVALGAAAGAVAAAAPCAITWGFTVDDALIPARYAHHLATGLGYRFNPHGPVTDGVTPLGFAHFLSPFARGGALEALAAARWLGLIAWLVGAAALGWRIARIEGSRWRWGGLAIMACSAPLAAWASAGLETGVVTGAVAVALALRHGAIREPLGPTLLGLAAAWRPELLPFAVVAGVPAARAAAASSGARLVPTWSHVGRLLLVVAPFVTVAGLRFVYFGRAAPLSLVAKQSTISAGATYAAACFVLTGPLALLALTFAPRAPAYARWLAAAVAAHFAAVAFAGGDWMPLSRLVVPALPAVVLASSEALASCRAWARAPVAAALALELWVWAGPGGRARRVLSDRIVAIDAARSALADADVIATLDVGWVAAAAPHAQILDLAGVTDPEVAILRGSHTSKPVPDALLASRRVDALVLLLDGEAPVDVDWTRSRFARGVERWVALAPGMGGAMTPVLTTSGRLRYVVLRGRL